MTSIEKAKSEGVSHVKMAEHISHLIERYNLSESDYTMKWLENGTTTACFLITGELEQVYKPLPSSSTEGKGSIKKETKSASSKKGKKT